MIISRTPFRISLFGGGTDYPRWYREHGGAVLAATIDKYCYISVRVLPPFFTHRFRVVYSVVESVREVAEISHPSVRAVLQHFGIEQGLEIHHDGDLPARSGIGSSSAFTVGLIAAVRALEGRPASKRGLAREAIHVEQCLLHEPVGVQDQISAAFGGFNHMVFERDGSFAIEPVDLPRPRLEALQDHLLLLYTGMSRTSADVSRTVLTNLKARYAQLRALQQTVDTAKALLLSPVTDLAELGRLLHETWLRKQELSEAVSNETVNEIYATARRAGAIGGKLLGAGGGGFMLLFVRPEQRACVRAALQQLIAVPFRFEHCGSSIVVNQPDGR
jgi:D-glycero-alpha-D-manno-heptose-7-phosphate kinase